MSLRERVGQRWTSKTTACPVLRCGDKQACCSAASTRSPAPSLQAGFPATDASTRAQVSALELEQACIRCLPEIREAAAVACPPPGGGPDKLYLFLVLHETSGSRAAGELLQRCRKAVREELNPLFRLEQVSSVLETCLTC